MPTEAHMTTDPAEALEVCGEFLAARPIDHNVILTVLERRIAKPAPGRYWWVSLDEAIRGFALLSPLDFHSAITPLPPSCVEAIADLMGETTPDLVGVAGEATSAAAFAARWGERTRVSVVPAEAQRIYRLDELHPPSMVSGSFRQATNADRDTLIAYRIAFENDVGQPGDSDPASAVDESLVGGRAFVWCDPEPVATVGISRPTAGVARLGPVYTPLSLRRRGYGSACVAAASQWVRDNDDAECILYTQLSNPTSNAICRALGYEPAGDVLMYRFGTPAAFR